MNIIEILKNWSYDNEIVPNSFFVVQDETASSTYGGVDAPGMWWSRSGVFQAEFPVLLLETLKYNYDYPQLCVKYRLTILSQPCIAGLNHRKTIDRLTYFMIDFMNNLSEQDNSGATKLEGAVDVMPVFDRKYSINIDTSAEVIGIDVDFDVCTCYLEQSETTPANRCAVC